MKKVYFQDNLIAFCGDCGPAGLEEIPHGGGRAVTLDAEALALESHAALSITKLRRKFENAKSLTFLSPSEEASERLFARFVEQFTLIDAGGGVVRSPRGELLMIHRKGRWDLPKGKMECGEQIGSCALREVEEECGIGQLALGSLLTQTYHIYSMAEYPGGNPDRWILKRTWWFAMEGDGSLSPQSEEGIEQAVWVPSEGIAERAAASYATVRDVLQAAGVFKG